MPKPPTLTVTLPTGEVLKRATWHKYTHVVVAIHPTLPPKVLAWCGSLALAGTQATHWGNAPRRNWVMTEADHRTIKIMPVDLPEIYRVEVIADNSGQWCGNGKKFATVELAETYARDLWSRWTLVRSWRVIDDDQKVWEESK